MADFGRRLGMERLDDSVSGPWEAGIGTVRVRFGTGRLAELGEAVAGLGIERPLVVGDPGVRAAGHLTAASAALGAAGLEVAVWDRVAENPSESDVAAGADAAAAHRADGLVAVGGGSVMDCVKGINFVHTNGGRMADYQGHGRTRRPLLPSVGVPTTAGTGSEAQSYALITHPETKEKMACGDPGAVFREVILDPALLATAPRPVAATSGLDALSHAVESHVSSRRNPVSALYSQRAWELLDGAFEAALDGGNPHSRAAMLLGAHLAGAAIEQSMLGAAHAAANPLTARHGVAHGAAVLLMLPAVVRFNGETVDGLYRRLVGESDDPSAAGALARRLEELRAAGGLPAALREIGVGRGELPSLAAAATTQWTGRFNPRPVGREEYRRLYETAY